jgi:peptidoglycan/LPS O-acetylase OafA/YrhL
MTKLKETKRLDWLQSLRGVAALLVVFAHSYYFLQGTEYDALARSILLPGAMGVDIFFLISGFIMTLTTRQNDGSLITTSTFLIKRFFRVWPIYAILTIAAVFLLRPSGFLNDPTGQITLIKSLSFLPVNPSTPPYFGLAYGLGWTLNFEMYFYAILGISLLAKNYRWPVFYSWIFITIVAIPLTATGMISLSAKHDYQFSLIYLNQIANPIILLFVAGVITGKLYLSEFVIKNKTYARVLSALTVLVALAWAYSGIPDFHGMLGWGLPITVAFLTVAISSKTLKFNPPRWIIWIGEISYSLYLTHRLTQVSCTKILEFIGAESFGKTWLFVILTTLLSILMASIFYYLVEKKIAVALQRLTKSRTTNLSGVSANGREHS